MVITDAYIVPASFDQRGAALMSAQRAERELADLRQESSRLESRLSSVRDRIVKLEHYIEMAREFGDGESTRANETHSANQERQRAPRGGMSGRAVQECIAILRERGHPIQTKELYALIERRGIKLGGKTPIGSLSGCLSRTPGLVADRSRGWSLIEWTTEEPESAAPTQERDQWENEAAE
jgi:hypothetical protein